MSDAPSPTLPLHGPPQHYLGGIALRLLAMISLSLMFVLVKKIDAADIHIVESLFWRQALVLPFLLAWVMATSGLSSLKTRSEEHTSELQSLMRISYAVFCLKKKTKKSTTQ